MTQKLAVGSAITYHRYVPATKDAAASNVPTPATILRIADAKEGIVDLAYLNADRADLLSGADWSNAFVRVTGVPYEGSEGESHHGWEEADAELKAMLSHSEKTEAAVDGFRDFILAHYPDAGKDGSTLFEFATNLLTPKAPEPPSPELKPQLVNVTPPAEAQGQADPPVN